MPLEKHIILWWQRIFQWHKPKSHTALQIVNFEERSKHWSNKKKSVVSRSFVFFLVTRSFVYRFIYCARIKEFKESSGWRRILCFFMLKVRSEYFKNLKLSNSKAQAFEAIKSLRSNGAASSINLFWSSTTHILSKPFWK